MSLTHCSLVLLFYTPWKHQKTFRSSVFRGYRKETLGCNGWSNTEAMLQFNPSEIYSIGVYSIKCLLVLNKASLIENWSVVLCFIPHWCWWDLERKEQFKLMMSLVCTLIALIFASISFWDSTEIEFWARLFSRIAELLLFHRYLLSRPKHWEHQFAWAQWKNEEESLNFKMACL